MRRSRFTEHRSGGPPERKPRARPTPTLPRLKRTPPAPGQQNAYGPRQQHLPPSTTAALTRAGVPAPPSISPPSISPPSRSTAPSRSTPTTSPLPTALLELADLISPGPTAKDTAAAAHRLGVKANGAVAKLTADLFGPASSKIASGLEHTAEQAVGRVAQAAALPSALHERPQKVAGKKVLGTPTTGQILKAAHKGNLRVNQRGKVTIPVPRQAARGLAQARKAVQPTGITGVTHGAEATRFADALAKYTRLDPRAMGAWVQTEGGGYAAGGKAGRNNWLGVGYPGEPTPFGRSSHFSGSPEKAAKATAQWMKGVIGGEYGYSSGPETPTNFGLQTFTTKLPIQAGDTIGLDNNAGGDRLGVAEPGESEYLYWEPPLADGSTRLLTGFYLGKELALNADVQPLPTVSSISPTSGRLPAAPR
jgi:hypothetical protein